MSIFKSEAKKKEELKAAIVPLIAEARVFLSNIRTMKRIPALAPPESLLLEKNEQLILADPTTLRETRSVRQNSGGFGGTRIGRVRVGGYSGTSFSSLQWANLDEGYLFLTNQKLIFKGNKENRIVPLRSITTLQPLPFGTISISIAGRAKSIQFPVRNPYLWEAATKVARNVMGNNIQLNAVPPSVGNLNDLEKLADLKTKGVITEEEFMAKKKQILGL